MLLQCNEFHLHILHDSLLGGNAYCCMIGTIAPEESLLEHYVYTENSAESE